MAKQKEKENEKNSVVFIHLDRPREIRFGHRSLKRLGALTNKKLVELGNNDFSMEDIEKVIYCGILSDAIEHGEDLKLEDMEDLLDKAKSYGDIVQAMNQAMEMAFQMTEKQKN